MAVRKLITIEGQQRPYGEGHWVVWGPDGEACGFMSTTARTADDPVKAAREFFGGSKEAISQLNAGYRIELTTREEARKIMEDFYGGPLG